MKKFYYLATCDTCKRIRNELNLASDVALREIKSDPLSDEEIDKLAEKAGSYEAIFSKRARKYREFGLNEQDLSEDEFRKYLAIDYTFLKRPIFETDTELVAGNSKRAVAKMAELSSS